MGAADRATHNRKNDCPDNYWFVIPTLHFLTIQMVPTTPVEIRRRVSSSLQSQDASLHSFFQYPTHFFQLTIHSFSLFYQSNKGSSINHPGEEGLLIIRYKPKAQCRDTQIPESRVPIGTRHIGKLIEPTKRVPQITTPRSIVGLSHKQISCLCTLNTSLQAPLSLRCTFVSIRAFSHFLPIT